MLRVPQRTSKGDIMLTKQDKVVIDSIRTSFNSIKRIEADTELTEMFGANKTAEMIAKLNSKITAVLRANIINRTEAELYINSNS